MSTFLILQHGKNVESNFTKGSMDWFMLGPDRPASGLSPPPKNAKGRLAETDECTIIPAPVHNCCSSEMEAIASSCIPTGPSMHLA